MEEGALRRRKVRSDPGLRPGAFLPGGFAPLRLRRGSAPRGFAPPRLRRGFAPPRLRRGSAPRGFAPK